jgi:coproporphyrinogen III oxidase-like Fe-S oxidoreductase
VLAPGAYVQRLEDGAAAEFPFSPAAVERIPVSAADARNETMLLGMRLVGEGVRETDFQARFGTGLREAFGRPLRRLAALGLVEWDAAGARLTSNGRLLGNRVFREFV